VRLRRERVASAASIAAVIMLINYLEWKWYFEVLTVVPTYLLALYVIYFYTYDERLDPTPAVIVGRYHDENQEP
jgi:hypothetical protein